ncbi:MAG: site-specific DNA-methyltransferase [Bacteroidales bacterium]|nr:site-specific DNA-methyltransferase [Bacteroidales bacterium]
MPIDRPHLIERIKSIEGLTPDERSQLLEMLRTTPKYGLVWEDKPEDAERLLEDNLPVLTEVKERYIAGSSPDSPNHILIEGDNLHALTALTYTHEGKIDVIYIDPPYNTGNKDFCYNDSYVDAEDSFKHSKWLSFMVKRLRLAKRLLSEKGVIFISIDDNEQAQLKLLCDSIYGQNNFLGNVIWEKTDSPRMDVKGFYTRHDYILVYRNEEFTLKRVPNKEVPAHYNRKDEKGRLYYTKPLRLMGGHLSESLFYSITAPDGTIVFPYEKDGKKGGWRWSQQKFIDENERIEWVNGKNGWTPYFRIYAENLKEVPAATLWPFTEVGSTRTAKAEFNQIIEDGRSFNYPKPTSLIKYIEVIASEQNATILDFFAGSGTTLHATMQLNAEDGGKRQCILVTNNENGICENVTYERNKRVINGYTTPKGVAVEGLHNNSLRYYQTDFVPRKKTMANMRRLVNLATDLLCIKHDLYDEARFFGKKLNKDVARFFSNGKKQMLILYDERAVDPVAEILEHQAVDSPIIVYVFSPDNYAYDEEFAAVADKVNLCALPAAIYAAYRHVLPKKKLYHKETLQEPTATPSPSPQGIEQLLFDPDEEEGPDGSA